MWLLWLVTAGAADDALPSVDLAEEAELHFQMGAEAYGAGQFSAALAHFLRSHRLAPNRSTAFNIARVYDEGGRPDQAWRYYNASLLGETDPTLQAPALQAMTRLEPQIARVQVNSDPPGADVYVGSQDLGSRGKAPMTLALLPGKHTLVLDLKGYSPVELAQVFPRNGLFEVAATLERDEADRRASALDSVWVSSRITVKDQVVFQVEPLRCELFPDQLSGVSAWREPERRLPGPVPGSVLAVRDETDASLDVTVQDLRSRRTSRLPLTRGKKSDWYDQAGVIHAWVLNRCEITNGAAVADLLEDLPKKVRAEIIPLLAELSTDEGLEEASVACTKGKCQPFGEALRF